MQLFDLVFIIALPLLLLLVALVMSVRKRLRRSKLLKQYPGATLYDVRFADHASLIAGQNLRLQAARGFLLVQGSKFQLNGVMPGSGVKLDIELPSGSKVTWIPKTRAAMGIPDLIRITAGARPQYVFVEKSAIIGGRQSTRTLYSELARSFGEEQFNAAGSKFFELLVPALFVLMIAALVALLYFSAQLTRDFGIQMISVSDTGYRAAASRTDLLVIAPDDSIKKSIPLVLLDINFSSMSDLLLINPNQAYMGDYDSGSIMQCDLLSEECKALPTFNSEEHRFRQAFKFAIAPDNHTIIASDTARHRLVQIDLIDGSVFQISKQDVCFPNKVAIQPDGRVFVADTNYHRILEWPSWKTWLTDTPVVHPMVEKQPAVVRCSKNVATGDAFLDRSVQFTESAETTAFKIARKNSTWPVDFDFGPDGNPWVIMGIRSGDILIFDQAWQPLTKLTLPRNSDPTQIVRDGQLMLMADPSDDKVRKFNPRGEYAGDLSDAGVGKFVREKSLRQSRMVKLRTYSLIATFGLLLFAIAIGRLATRKRLTQIAATAPVGY